MNPFIQQIINQKIKTLTVQELLKHAKSYHVSLTSMEAEKIIGILRSEPYINVQDDEQHRKIIKRIGKEINIELAKKANELLKQFKNK